MLLEARNEQRLVPRLTIPRALGASMVLHLALFLGVEAGYRLNWWSTSLIRQFLRADVPRHSAVEMAQRQQEPPLLFIEVLPSQASEVAPADAQYYSAHHSQASNPENESDTPIPQVDGTQDQAPRIADRIWTEVPAPAAPEPSRPEAVPLQPQLQAQAPPEPETPQPTLPQLPERQAPPPGETAQATIEERVRPAEAIPWDFSPVPPARERPRTLAAARPEEPRLYGERMKQDGGGRRFSLDYSLDVRATPFGAYDQRVIEAIQKRWYDLLDERTYSRNHRGKVVVEFRLSSDGQVSAMRVSENEVSDLLSLLCQRAIQDPAPYAPWPEEMRRVIGSDYREVRFTFHYN